VSLQDQLDSLTPLVGMDWVISALRAVRVFNEGNLEHQAWIDDALRLLEAASGVDKARSIQALEGVFVFAAIHGMTELDPDIIAAMNMIKALPDTETEVKK
jgi:hypothetical protein